MKKSGQGLLWVSTPRIAPDYRFSGGFLGYCRSNVAIRLSAPRIPGTLACPFYCAQAAGGGAEATRVYSTRAWVPNGFALPTSNPLVYWMVGFRLLQRARPSLVGSTLALVTITICICLGCGRGKRVVAVPGSEKPSAVLVDIISTEGSWRHLPPPCP